MINAERLDLLLRLLRILKCDLGGVWGRCVCEYIIAASCTVGWNSTLRNVQEAVAAMKIICVQCFYL